MWIQWEYFAEKIMKFDLIGLFSVQKGPENMASRAIIYTYLKVPWYAYKPGFMVLHWNLIEKMDKIYKNPDSEVCYHYNFILINQSIW